MSDRPIIFSGPMVRAILAGTKTQTRRVVTPEPHAGVRYRMGGGAVEDGHGRPINPRYGVPGDRLWVRETWAYASEIVSGGQVPDGPYYEAEGIPIIAVGRWRSPIYMPRWASRLTLEITDVRVQRLQDISEEDAKAEGAPNERPRNAYLGIRPRSVFLGMEKVSHKEGFAALWDSLNGKRAPWSSNPWVWAISFKDVA